MPILTYVTVCCRTLQQLCDAFEPLPPTNRPASYAPKSVTDIAERNYTLSDNIKFRLLGAIKLYPALYNIPTPNVMTPAEELALQVRAACSISFANVSFATFKPHPHWEATRDAEEIYLSHFIACCLCTGLLLQQDLRILICFASCVASSVDEASVAWLSHLTPSSHTKAHPQF